MPKKNLKKKKTPKEHIKVKLVKMFSETKYKQTEVSEEYIEEYTNLLWDSVFKRCKERIETGYIEKISVNSYSVNPLIHRIDEHERQRIFNDIFPHFEKQIIDFEIPYKIVKDDYDNPSMEMDFDDLKEFSNVNNLAALK